MVMKRRYAFLVASLGLACICLYPLALSVCTTGKLLGWGYAFDLWSGSISRSTTHIGAIPVDVYTGPRSKFPVVLVHGVNETGKDSPDLRKVGEALAGAGYRVVVPDRVRLRHQTLSPDDADDVLSVFESLGSDGGIVCASYGCGPALIAASRAEIRDRVRFVATFGSYFNLTDTLRFLVTSPPTALAYSKWIYMRANLQLVRNDADRNSLSAIGVEREMQPTEEWTLGSECLGPEGRAILALYESQNASEFDSRLGNLPLLRHRMERLSPANYIEGIRA